MTPTGLNKTLLDQLANAVAQKNQSYAKDRAAVQSTLLAARIAALSKQDKPNPWTRISDLSNMSSLEHPPAPEGGDDTDNWFSTALGYLNRPLHAVAGAALEGSKFFNKDVTHESNVDYENPFAAAWKNITGERSDDFTDVILQNFKPGVGEGKLFGEDSPNIGVNLGNIGPLDLSIQDTNPSIKKAVAGVGGGILNLTADPLNYVPLGPVAKGVSKVGKAISGTSKLEKLAKEGIELTPEGNAATEAAKQRQLDEFAVKRYQELKDQAKKDAGLEATLSGPQAKGATLADQLAEALKGTGVKPDQLDVPTFTDTTGQMPRTKLQKKAQEAAAATPMPTFSTKPEVQEAIPATPKPAPPATFSDTLIGPQVAETPGLHFDDAQRAPVEAPTFSSAPTTQEGIKLPEATLPGAGPTFSDAGTVAPKVTKSGTFPDATPTFLAHGETTTLPKAGDELAAKLKPQEIADLAKPANAGRQTAIGNEIAKAVSDPAVNVSTTSVPRLAKSNEIRDIAAQHDDANSIGLAYAKQADSVGIDAATKAKYVADNTTAELSAIKHIKSEQGVYPVLKSQDNAYHIDVSDVYKTLGDDLAKYHGVIPATNMMKATGRVLDSTMAGLGKEETLAAVLDTVPKTKAGTEFANVITGKSGELAKVVADNELAYGVRDAAKGEQIADRVSAETVASVDNPVKPKSEQLQDVANITGKIKDAARAEGVGPAGTMHAVSKTVNNLEGKIPINDVSAARTVLANAKKIEKGGDKVKLSKEIKERLKVQARKDAEEAQRLASPEIALDDIKALELNNIIQRGIQTFLDKTVMGHGAKQLADRMRNEYTAGILEQSQHSHKLAQIQKVHKAPAIDAAYTAIRSGHTIEQVTDPAAKAAYKDLYDTVRDLLPLSKEDRAAIADSSFSREGDDWWKLNNSFKEAGIKDFEFDPSKAKKPADVIRQLLDYQPKNVIEFLDNLKSAQVKYVTRKKWSAYVADTFGVPIGTANSVRIRPGGDKLTPFLDRSVAYPHEVARMIDKFVKTYDMPTSFAGSAGAAGWLANKVINPYLRIWKPAATIARPGHHVRNMISDIILNGMAGVWSPRHYMGSANIMRAGGKFDGDVSSLQQLHGKEPLPAAGDKAFDIVTQAGKEPISYATLYQRAASDGLILSGRMSEDIEKVLGKETTWLDKNVTEKMMDTRWMRGMATVSEAENNFARLAQYHKHMSDPKFTKQYRNIKEASHAAVTETQKFHPDIQGLTVQERKYGRMGVPFYSFTRQVLPVVFHTFIEHPTRLTAVPKVTYAAQVAMGGNPESIEKPFDPNTRYPGFITQNLTGNFPIFGGQGQFNFGTPVESINDYTKGPGIQPLIDDINPLIKTPIEAMSHHDPITDKYITDISEQVDAAIPFGRQLGDISSYSPTGTVGNLASGQPQLDPQRTKVKNGKDFLWNQSLLNWALGLGFNDLNKPSYQRSSVREIGG